MTIAKFAVVGGHRAFNGVSEATVFINRATGILTVRPKRQHRTYELPLADVAQRMVERILIAEAQAKVKAKKAKRKMFGALR